MDLWTYGSQQWNNKSDFLWGNSNATAEWLKREKQNTFPFVLCTDIAGAFPRAMDRNRLTYLKFGSYQSKKKCANVTVVNRIGKFHGLLLLPVSVSNEIRLIELTSEIFVNIISLLFGPFNGCINSFRMNSVAEQIRISRFFKHNNIFGNSNRYWN